MSKVLVVVALLISVSAVAQPLLLKEGLYFDGNFKISVTQESFKRLGITHIWYAIRADGSEKGKAQYAQFYIDPETGNATKTPWRSGPGETLIGNYLADGDFILESTDQDGQGIVHFRWKLGGRWSAHDQIIEMQVDTKSGRLKSLGTNSKIAKFGLPNGWHSGPFKEVADCFNCSNFSFSPKLCPGDFTKLSKVPASL